MNKAYKQLGFSLIELMVVIAVMAVLSGIAFPAFGSMTAGNDLNTAQENIIDAMKKARGMAVSHSSFATITINSAARTVKLSLADGSHPDETISLRPNISIGADATLVFAATGTVAAQAGSTTITLSSPGYSSLPQRRIDVSPTGVVTATR
ncbi:MAG TPA: prepilin-type N-terminal cleavage/methylation domain-containing protein [Gallionella sp.]|nr:prepilin-type N-terminal cleavage/methylation domain-containing protein [Gallionella sp.]